MENLNLNTLLEFAVEASEKACAAILEVYHSNQFETEHKADHSPLTLADKRSHEVIERHLKPAGIPILSEEGKDIPYEERKQWRRLWLVDPLDGTKEFIKRNGEFTVNVALIEDQHPVLGVVAVPVTGEVFYGGKGFGVKKKFRDGKVVGLQSTVSGGAQPATGNRRLATGNRQLATRVVASRSHMNEETRAFIATLGQTEIIAAGSSLKFMLLAEGKADVYPRFGPTMEWDTAAAHAILNAAGMSLRMVNTEQELIYNKDNLLNPYFIAQRNFDTGDR